MKILSKLKFSLATNIIIGMVLGIIVGLFFGEPCGKMKILGDAFIQLLQMTVLPYIIVSLLLGIGGLTYSNAKLLAVKGGLLMLIYWAIAFAVILTLPVIFPVFEQASFFSTSMITQPPKVDYLALYIPANPFRSLSDNMVPAVVLLSLFMGVALIGLNEEKKKSLMVFLDAAKTVLTKVTHFVIKLTPLGVFVISASAAGTMTVEEFGRLQVYLAAYLLGAIAITFVILPALAAMLTPFPYKQVVSIARDALVTSFTTGNLFVVLPIIVENTQAAFESQNLKTKETEGYSDVIIPITFNFPNIGKLLALVFILFAGWFTGSQIHASQYPGFIASGLLTFFGSTDVALPFLLNYFRIPTDLFQLYMVSGIVIGKFATMIAAMNLFTFSLICTYSLTYGIKIKPTRLVGNMLMAVVIYAAMLVAGKITLQKLVKNNFTEADMLVSMKVDKLVETEVETKMPKPGFFAKLTGPPKKSNMFEDIKKSGVLRVGYCPNALPFAYFNKKKELVGYDIQMAQKLAQTMGCKLKFLPFDYKDFPNALKYNIIDIAMSCISVSPQRLHEVAFSKPYMEINIAFVVKGYMKDSYEKYSVIKKNLKDKTFALLKGSAYKNAMKAYFSEAKLVEIKDQKEFFDGKCKADALVTTAEQGSAWTLIYPHYKVAIPDKPAMKSLIAYALPKGDPEFLNYINYCLEMSKINGYSKEQYSYWILGHSPEKKEPRWCIAANVLHWF